MPTISYPGFLGPDYRSSSYMADSELSRNWYLEKNESAGAPFPWCMLPCPGFQTFASVSEGPIRGMFQQLGRAFFMAGYAFRELLADGTTILRGTVDADAHPVTIHANGDAGNQLWISSGGTGYNYDLGSNVLSPQGVGGTAVTMGSFLDARFLYLDASTGALYASALYDGTTWDATMVAQSESGDPWKAMVVTPDDLIHLFGETTSEAWANQGTSPFPFSKIAEASIPWGIAAPFGWSIDSTVTWLAQNVRGRGEILRAQGYTPNRISTHAIETAIQSYSTISDCTAFGYLEAGHEFTMFTFPTADQTWAVDGNNGLWHDRSYWDLATASYKAYRPGCMMEAFGKTLVGDRLSGTIYEMSTAFQTDVDGAVIRRMRQAPRFSVGQKRVTFNSLQLVMDTGVGTISGQGANPQMMLQTSRDGGKVFGPERWSSAGAIGAYGTRVRWLRNGQARNFVPRFVATDPAPWRIVDCLVDYTVGAN